MNIKNTPNAYKLKLTELEGGFQVLLDTYINQYVAAQTNPNNSNNQQQLKSTYNDISGILAKLFTMLNDLESDTQTVNKQIADLDKKIKKEKKNNTVLKKKLGIVDNNSHTSSEMISDYELIYEQRYLRNWALVLSGLACIVAIATVYKKSGNPPVV